MSKITITIEDNVEGGITVSSRLADCDDSHEVNTPAEILADAMLTAVIKEVGGEMIEPIETTTQDITTN